MLNSATELSERIRKSIREVSDFPKPGINFYDITTVLQDGDLFHETVSGIAEQIQRPVDAIVGVEARGFIFGASVAYALRLPFIPVRKPGKLPYHVESVAYELEYGQGKLEIHKDAIRPGDKVALVDDLLATGGTAAGTVELVKRLGGTVTQCLFAVELTFLPGRKLLTPCPVTSLVQYAT